MVVDLEINHRTRKLFAGAEGYGVWSSDLPCTNPTLATQQITQNVTLDFQTLLSPIEINSGYTLTIKGTLYCGTNAQIIVDPGAKLVIDGGKITTLTSCPTDNWLGITLLGDQYHPQDPAHQGLVELKNGAIIENAVNGIIVGDYNNGALNGGIIHAENATFLNCKRDVEFLWYTYAQSTSYFKNCTFKCTQILPNNNNYGTGDYVTLSGIQGVSFSGCTWECAIPTNTPPTNNNRGLGVFGIDFSASFENADNGTAVQVNPNCLLLAGPQCVFKNLTKGIEFERDNQDYHIYVQGCTFENVGVGIDMYGGHTTSQAPKGCVIWGNQFKWNATCLGSMPVGDAYYSGVRTGGAGNVRKFDNFYIDKNTFTIDLNVPQTPQAINIICTDVFNSGNYYHSEIFENNCMNSQIANGNHTAVRIQSNNEKLELQCGNIYSGFDHDWWLAGESTFNGTTFTLKDQTKDNTYGSSNTFTQGKPANIFFLNNNPSVFIPNAPATRYWAKTGTAYFPTTNGLTNGVSYVQNRIPQQACVPSDPCNIGGYVITEGGSGGNMGAAPTGKPQIGWTNKNELYNGANDFYSLANNNQLKLRPNPANDQVDILYYINIKNGNIGEISLINAEGKQVKKEQVYAMASTKTIDISNLVAGVYQVVLQQNGLVLANTKLVIVH